MQQKIDVERLNQVMLEHGVSTQAALIRKIKEFKGPDFASPSSATISRTCNHGECSMETLTLLAEVLEIDLQSLLILAEQQLHRVSGAWRGTYTLLLEHVSKLEKNGKRLPNEIGMVLADIEVQQKDNCGKASMTFHSKRKELELGPGRGEVHIPKASVRVFEGDRVVIEYQNEVTTRIQRLCTGICLLDRKGNTMSGSYAVQDPEFPTSVIPATIEWERLVGVNAADLTYAEILKSWGQQN